MSETEDDLILGEADYTLSDLIDNQLTVITTLLDIEIIAYDTFEEDRIKAIAQAMKMIHKCQRVLMSNI